MTRALHLTTVPLAIALGLSLAPISASAQTAKLQASQASRPLTLPRATLRFDGGPRWPMPGGQLEVRTGDIDDTMQLNLGLGAGFTDRFEAGLLALPFQIVPDTDVHDPVLYLLYALTGGQAQLGFFASMVLPVEGNLVLTGGLPLRVRLGGSARLDLAALLRLSVDPTHVGLIFPFELAFAVSNGFFLGPELGVVIPDLGEDAVGVPVGVFLGPTFVRGSRVIGDLRLGVRVMDVTSDYDLILVYARAALFFDV